MTYITSHKTRLAQLGLAVGLAATLGACGDGVIEVDNAGIVEQTEKLKQVHTEGELFYLKNVTEAAEAFGPEGALFTPRETFYSVTVMMTAPTGDTLEAQIQRPDGTWGEWTKANVTMNEGKFHSYVMEAPKGAKALRLRGAADVEFMRLEFFSVLTPEHDHSFDDEAHFAESHDDAALKEEEKTILALAHSGRWVVTGATATAAARNYVPYTSAPSYNGGRNCSGSFTAGARDLGNYLVANFDGAKYFQGYNCRQIRGSSGMSMHGTGRAIDVFIPLDRGQADNDLGDPVANWLIENAKEIGVQLIIWDRSIWSGGRTSNKHRQYNGVHPHHDHLHIELTPEAAARRTSWYSNMGSTPTPDPTPTPTPNQPQQCYSSVRGRSFNAGECVQMSYNSCGGTCQWAVCGDNGKWGCADVSQCSSKDAHASCQAPPAKASCNSATLGRSVSHGECVQMPYDKCGGTCNWAQCNDGRWVCTDTAACSGTKHDHASCQQTTPAPSNNTCYSQTLGRDVNDGEYVQMSYNSCGDTCKWARCTGGAWVCAGDPLGSDVKFPHAACAAPDVGTQSCYSQTLGRSVAPGKNVQMAYLACGGYCEWAQCVKGKWECSTPGYNERDYEHNYCKGN